MSVPNEPEIAPSAQEAQDSTIDFANRAYSRSSRLASRKLWVTMAQFGCSSKLAYDFPDPTVVACAVLSVGLAASVYCYSVAQTEKAV